MNCDRIAPWYRWIECLVFGRALKRRRCEYMAELGNARSTLILGDGDGRFTAEFVHGNRHSRVESVDLSSRMLDLARKRCSRSTPDRADLVFRQGDARVVELTGNYDLIVTHFFLDCFGSGDLERIIARVSKAAQPQARWVISEFQLPPNRILRFAARLLIQAMYAFFRMTTGLNTSCLPDHIPLFTKYGFRLVDRCSSFGGLLVSELWQRSEIHRSR